MIGLKDRGNGKWDMKLLGTQITGLHYWSRREGSGSLLH